MTPASPAPSLYFNTALAETQPISDLRTDYLQGRVFGNVKLKKVAIL